MTEQELRAIVREAVERHLRPDKVAAPVPARPVAPFSPLPHASHLMLRVVAGRDMDDGVCVIEPAVRCSHCGFCQSYGH